MINYNDFNNQTHQSFAKKPRGTKNAFNHRREYSANPYIGNDGSHNYNHQEGRLPHDHLQGGMTKHNNQHMEQYQTQIDKYKKAGGPMQPQPTKTRNSRWKPQDSSANNTQSDLSSMRSQNTKLHKKSQDSFKNSYNVQGLLSDENHPSVNPHVSDLANQLVPAYQTQGKRRAESYNIKRRGENSGSLDPLEYDMDGDNGWRKDDESEYQYIRSNNMK